MKKKAFLLFEALVAILVASVALVAIMQAVSSSLKINNVSQNYFRAVMLAESKIAMLGKDVSWKEETTSGKFSEEEDPKGIFSWVQKIRRVTTKRWGTVTELPVNEARVKVKWDGNEVELVTYVTRYDESRAER